jgi:hypothetical protein
VLANAGRSLGTHTASSIIALLPQESKSDLFNRFYSASNTHHLIRYSNVVMYVPLMRSRGH